MFSQETEEKFKHLASIYPRKRSALIPMLLYALAHVYALLGCERESSETYRLAAAADPLYVFPSRLEEILLLERACWRLGDQAQGAAHGFPRSNNH